MYGTPEKNNKVGIRYAYRHVSGNPFNTGVIIRDESNISDEAPCLTSLKAVGREPVLFLQVMFYRGALNQICPAQGGTVCQYLQTHYFFLGGKMVYAIFFTTPGIVYFTYEFYHDYSHKTITYLVARPLRLSQAVGDRSGTGGDRSETENRPLSPSVPACPLLDTWS